MQNDDWSSELQERFQTATTEQLEKWRHEIDILIENRKQTERREALEKIQQLAQAHGIALEDLAKKPKSSRNTASPGKKTGSQVAKYRNPDNQFQTWSGVGRKPKWVSEHIDSGKPLSDLEIKE